MQEVKSPKKPFLYYCLIVATIMVLLNSLVFPNVLKHSVKEVDYNTFMKMTENKEIGKVNIDSGEIIFTDKSEEKMYKTGVMDDPGLVDRLYDSGADFSSKITEEMSPILYFLLSYILPIAIFIMLGRWLSKKMMSKMNGGANPMNSMMFGGGKSNAKIYVKSSNGIKFSDVAGEDEAKELLSEIVDYLHDPDKYREMGAAMPRGALLVGPPGTGKTLLAKAVAGEAKVPFFSLSGSEFVEMFVGVGASRVRDLFEEAKKNAPCIVFIDEIDAIGKSRDSHYGGGNDEREQTLNQLLAEMDGFDTSKGLLILAATNRPEVLDPALLRPGRFDRRVIVDRPDLKGRVEILKVHAKDVLLDETVDLDAIALATSGAVGSDLANMINEAAILAVKNGRKAVSQKDLLESVEVVLVGKEKKDRILSPQERKIVSYHEVGHALVSALQKDAEPVQKITIVPRTMGALGYVMHVPEEEKFLNTQKELEAMLVGYLGGRAAEEIVFDTVTTGAANDIEQATKVARAMITQYGMSQKFGLMGLASQENQYLSGRAVLNCGDDTATEIDHEVMKLLHDSYEESKRLLRGHRTALDKIAEYLIRKETITGKEFMKIFRAVERGMEISENLDELVFPEDVKELEDKAENQEAEISQSHSAETTVSADELSGEKETVSSEAEPANKNQESVRMETEPAEEGAQGEQKKEDSPVPEDDQKQQESENVSD